DCTGTGSLSDIARAIVFATDRGAKIINISLGSPGDGQTLHDAVRYAAGKGVLVVAAAGNCGVSNPVCAGLNQPDYPAAYAESFAVGATTTDGLGLPGTDKAFGAGRVNALRAVGAARQIVGTATYDTSAIPRTIALGSQFRASIRVTNTSTTPWVGSTIHLTYKRINAAGV